MKKGFLPVLVAGIALAIAGQAAFSNGNPASPITISPQTFLLSWDQSGSVTVHTDIPLVGDPSVMLESVSAGAVFADSRGHLVAKFSESAVEAIVTPPSATLTLYVNGADVGSDTVRVIE